MPGIGIGPRMPSEAAVTIESRPREASCGASTVAVVVTYGRRVGLCTKTVHSALLAGADHVVVIDNGSPAENAQDLSMLPDETPGQVTVLRRANNGGSAHGYAAGIDAALARGAQYVWLLDDDNVAEPDALTALHAAGRAAASRPGPTVVVAFRPHRSYQQSLVDGTPVDCVFPSPSCFLHLHLGDRLVRRPLGRLRRSNGRASDSVIQIPYGPYGGALLSRSTIARIGLPDTRLGLYEDDTDFMYRVTQQRGQVLLVTASVIQDSDANWFVLTRGTTGPGRLLVADSALRVYSSVRNRVFFERYTYRTSVLVYTLNKIAYLTALKFLSMRIGVPGRHALILQAIRDGEAGNLTAVPRGVKL